MKQSRNPGYVLLPLALAVGIVGGIFIGRIPSADSKFEKNEKLATILSLIDEQYVDKINIDSLLDTMIPDLLGSLDPHSAYIPKSELTAVNDELEGSFSGVGVSFQIINDSVRVVEVVAGGPAEKVGILPGDIILSAGDSIISRPGVLNETVFKNLRGKEGSTVTLGIKRPSSPKPLEFDVVRGEIPQLSVDCSYLLRDNIGYVRVNKFARNTYVEFLKAINELRDKGAEKFVIDLRNNAGGFMDQAIYMANEFLPEGRKIVYTKGRQAANETMAISDGNGRLQEAEIVVLMNEYSASASEIFAGAIQDNDRGLVIGRRSFGKGLVQNQIDLPDSSAIRLTVARYYTPSGRSIQKEYTRGKDGKYQLDIVDRYTHGEFYSQDSIKLNKNLEFITVGGRKVYGGGGIMPDVFVAEDTTGYTSYYIDAVNKGLIQKFSYRFAEKYRNVLGNDKTLDNLLRVLPRDNTLLKTFVAYAASEGLPARWYYINQSKDLIINELKAVIARDLIGYNSFIQMLNDNDKTVIEGVRMLIQGKSKVDLGVKTPSQKRK